MKYQDNFTEEKYGIATIIMAHKIPILVYNDNPSTM